jgi:hypothetical protein
MIKVLMLLILGIFVVGCISVGTGLTDPRVKIANFSGVEYLTMGNPKVKTFDMTTIEYGKTTKAEILAKLGEPEKKTAELGGAEGWSYTYGELQSGKPDNNWIGQYYFAFNRDGILQKEGTSALVNGKEIR